MTFSRLFYKCFILLVLLLGSAQISLMAQPNFYETTEIEKKILKDFNTLIDEWREELYFEMYELGTIQSKNELSKIEFVQRMVDLKWKPSLNPIKNKEIKIIYRNFSVIHFDQEFVHKIDQSRLLEKRMIFPATMYQDGWKFDLTQLINIPYVGKIVVKENKAEKKQVEEKQTSQ